MPAVICHVLSITLGGQQKEHLGDNLQVNCNNSGVDFTFDTSESEYEEHHY